MNNFKIGNVAALPNATSIGYGNMYNKWNYRNFVKQINPKSIDYTIEKEDVIFIFAWENFEYCLYIVRKCPNKAYFNHLLSTIYSSYLYGALYTDGNWIRIPNIQYVRPENFSGEIGIEYIAMITQNWWFLELNTYDFIFTNIGIIFIGIDKILPKINFLGRNLFLRGPLDSEIQQDIGNGLNNKDFLFIDSATNMYISRENITGIKELEQRVKEIKNYEFN